MNKYLTFLFLFPALLFGQSVGSFWRVENLTAKVGKTLPPGYLIYVKSVPGWYNATDTIKSTTTMQGAIAAGDVINISSDVMVLQASSASQTGDVVYINGSAKAQFCRADTIPNCRYAYAICLDASIPANGFGNWLTKGFLYKSGWSWAVGGLVYVSTIGSSGNTLTQTAPSGANNVIMPIGVALSPTVLYFSGNINSVEHQ